MKLHWVDKSLIIPRTRNRRLLKIGNKKKHRTCMRPGAFFYEIDPRFKSVNIKVNAKTGETTSRQTGALRARPCASKSNCARHRGCGTRVEFVFSA